MADLTTGLVGHWPLAYDANDRSGGGWNGTLQGGVGFNAGRGLGALDCDGTDDRVSISTSFTLTFPFSICAWVRPTSFANTFLNIFTKRDTFSNTEMVWQFDVRTLAGGGFRILHGTTTATTSVEAPLDTWTHVVLTDNGQGTNDIKCYKDGALAATITNTAALGTKTTATVQISGFNGTNELFQGQLSDVRAYNRILSAAEAHAIFSLQVARLQALRPSIFVPGHGR